MSTGDGNPVSPWEKRFHRERRARKEAERLLQEKSRALYDANLQLRTLLRTMEQQVEARTAEADAARLKAEFASLAKSRFLATMSHEIRTPMNGVVGMADYLSTTDLNADQRSGMSTIQTASATLRRLLDDLLDLSRLESGKLDLSPTEFSPQELLDDLIRLHRPTASQRNLALTTEVSGPLPARVSADRMRINQVIGNLLDNAVKFTEQGSIRLMVSWRDNAMALSVIDTGVGIPKEARADLFSRFAQADSSTSRVYGGSGLGLAICHELVYLMNGTIALDDTVEQGTKMDVLFPMSAVDSEEKVDQAQEPVASTSKNILSGLRVLVVDDNPINLLVATRLLEWLGCEVETRSDGHRGVEAAVEQPFDVILMDLHMPVMDGFEAMQELCERFQASGREAPPVFALTADAIEGVAERCTRRGMRGLIPKPVTREVLYQYLHTLT